MVVKLVFLYNYKQLYTNNYYISLVNYKLLYFYIHEGSLSFGKTKSGFLPKAIKRFGI